jgi:hypothetical protein
MGAIDPLSACTSLPLVRRKQAPARQTRLTAARSLIQTMKRLHKNVKEHANEDKAQCQADNPKIRKAGAGLFSRIANLKMLPQIAALHVIDPPASNPELFF